MKETPIDRTSCYMKNIRLLRGQIAKVDDADFEWLSDFKWYQSNGNISSVCNGKRMTAGGYKWQYTNDRF